jgi:hypothetical protein
MNIHEAFITKHRLKFQFQLYLNTDNTLSEKTHMITQTYSEEKKCTQSL